MKKRNCKERTLVKFIKVFLKDQEAYYVYQNKKKKRKKKRHIMCVLGRIIDAIASQIKESPYLYIYIHIYIYICVIFSYIF